MQDHRQKAIAGIVASILVGAVVGAAGSDGSSRAGAVSVFALCGLLAFVINWVAFIPASRAQTEHYYDLTGSLTYLTVTAAALALSKQIDWRAGLVAVMVGAWAVRLGTFLARRVRRDGGDGRFDEIKVDPLRFLMAWTVQGLWVFLTLAAALAIITGTERRQIGLFGTVGIIVWIVGFAIEVVADRQKSAFKRDPANQGRFITSGLWAWSRHPNYFGEIALWTGIAIMAIPILSGWRWLVLISPVFVTLLLTRASGIPILEKRAQQRWGDEAAYQDYVKETPVLVLRPPRR